MVGSLLVWINKRRKRGKKRKSWTSLFSTISKGGTKEGEGREGKEGEEGEERAYLLSRAFVEGAGGALERLAEERGEGEGEAGVSDGLFTAPAMGGLFVRATPNPKLIQ